MEDFTQTFENENLVLLGIDYWEGDELQVNRFVQNAGVEFPVLMVGEAVTQSFNIFDRSHYIIIGPDLTIRYTSKDSEDSYDEDFKPELVQPAITEALAELEQTPVLPYPINSEGVSPEKIFSYDLLGRHLTPAKKFNLKNYKRLDVIEGK